MDFRIPVSITSLLVLGGVAILPNSGNAQSLRHRIHHRRKTESQWRAGTYAGAALGAIGLATHKDTLTAVGAGVAGYSGYRWSEDMKSRHRLQRLRYRHRHYRHHG